MPKTMIVEAQVSINGTKTAVWTVITNIRNASEIISGIDKIEILNEPANGLIGLKWRETRMYFGKPATIEKWITDAIENKFYKTRAETDGFIFLTTITISESGEDIRLTSSHETKSQGIIARIKSLPMIFFKGMLKKTILQDLNDFKTAVEHK
jgi:carbon monoxide dehydrogenase subunit G